MGEIREFTSHPAKAPQQFQFRLDGQLFTCVLRMDADAVLEWSDMAHGAAESEAGIDTAEGAALIGRYFRLFMLPDEHKRFRAHLQRTKPDPDVLGEVMAAINAEMEALTGQSTGRPTQQPSRSSGGRAAKDDRTLQIISLPDGEVEWADEVPGSRQQRRARGRQQRPRRQRTG